MYFSQLGFKAVLFLGTFKNNYLHLAFEEDNLSELSHCLLFDVLYRVPWEARWPHSQWACLRIKWPGQYTNVRVPLNDVIHCIDVVFYSNQNASSLFVLNKFALMTKCIVVLIFCFNLVCNQWKFKLFPHFWSGEKFETV